MLSKNNSDIVNYYGVVNNIELSEIIGNTDLLLNPHVKMDGVFPLN